MGIYAKLGRLLLAVVAMAGAHRGWAAGAAPPPLSLYGKLPGFERAAISPSGDRIAMVALHDNERRLIVVDRNNKLLSIQNVGNIKVRGLYWAGEDRVLLRRSETQSLGIGFTADKAEFSAMIVIPLNGEKLFSVFQGNNRIPGGIRGFHGVVEREGRYYGYFGGITLDESRGAAYLGSTSPVLYEVDLQNGRASRLANRVDSEQNWRTWLVGSNGAVSATLDFRSSGGDWFIRNAEGKRIAAGTNPLGGIDLVGFGETPDSLIYSVEDETNDRSQRWFEVPLAGGEAREILTDTAMAGTFFDNRSRALLGYEIEGDTPSYRFTDPRHQKAVDATLKAFPGRSVHLVDWNDAFDRLLVMTEGQGDPESWWVVDIKTKRADPLGTAYPMGSEAVGPMRMVRYKAGDGLDISAVLTLPPGRPARNLPVVVLPHGGPSSRDYPGFDWWAQAFASRGYAVLQPNFRGSTGYGVAFQRAGNGEWGRRMQTDISDGLAYLVKEGIADPKRACIMGASYGGYAALAGVTLQKGIYRCAVSVAGVSDVQKMTSTDLAESGRNPTLRRALKAEIGFGSDLRAVSPVNFAAEADAPVLLIHGKDDVVVLYDQSVAMANALRRAGKPVELVTLAGEDHWLSRSASRLAMLEASVAFVEKHNPPDPAP
ncbi:alpha/beta hydrolase family protein [Edaphosphingomonas haloaromaticamans]|uniref:Esterase n=1 Tax=Edaphosphingomonas haloaromaticamans TaxID=653954 RepID=A0A1S1HF69_9SPHN|nr:S9 family peptidase [Sphingomonas haloaromaticamans]OHT19160.1 esterase [Sphingomonas haloaromaticamans]